MSNFKTAKYARDSWTQVKKKLSARLPKAGEGGDDDAAGEATEVNGKADKKKGAGRKRKNGTGFTVVCR